MRRSAGGPRSRFGADRSCQASSGRRGSADRPVRHRAAVERPETTLWRRPGTGGGCFRLSDGDTPPASPRRAGAVAVPRSQAGQRHPRRSARRAVAIPAPRARGAPRTRRSAAPRACGGRDRSLPCERLERCHAQRARCGRDGGQQCHRRKDEDGCTEGEGSSGRRRARCVPPCNTSSCPLTPTQGTE